MNMKRYFRQLLSMLLILSFLLADILFSAFAEGEGPSSASQSSDTVRYYEIRFDLAEDTELPPADEPQIFLPETMLLASDIPLYTIQAPRWLGHTFLGWYYDAQLLHRVGSEDVPDRNLTLYPRFVLNGEEDPELLIDYIAVQDASPEEPIRIVVYGLSEDEVRARLSLRQINSLGGSLDYRLTREYPDLDTLIPDAQTRVRAEEILARSAEGSPEGDLTDALLEAGLEEGAVRVIVSGFAPEEAERRRGAEAMEAALDELGMSGCETPEQILEGLWELNGEDEELMLAWLQDELGMDVSSIQDLDAQQIALRLAEAAAERYANDELSGIICLITPADGAWGWGDSYQAELTDTEGIRFMDGNEPAGRQVIYYNISIYSAQFNNSLLQSSLVFLPRDQVEGVEMNLGLVDVREEQDGELTSRKQEIRGEMVYHGDEVLFPGQTVAVYDGTLLEDQTVDGDLSYVKITADLGNGHYVYEGPDFLDVISMPDNIPVRDDGSFEDGSIFVSADQLIFEGEPYDEMNLNPGTTVNVGDMITVYSGSFDEPDTLALTGYGQITQAVPAEGGLRLRYRILTESELDRLCALYAQVDNLPLPLSEEQQRSLMEEGTRNLEESGIVDKTQEYVEAILSGRMDPEDDPEMARVYQGLRFQTDTGKEMSLEEVRRLAAKSGWSLERPYVSALASLKLQHFSGTGVRIVFAVTMGVRFDFRGGKNTLKINATAQIETEVAVGLKCSFKILWAKK